MARFPQRPFASWLVPALLLGAAYLALGGSRAEASCGDYVMVGGHGRHHSGLRQSELAEAGLDGIAARIDSENWPIRRGGCSGPHCSQDSGRPLGTPAAPIKIVVRQWGVLSLQADRSAGDVHFVQFQDDAPAPRLIAASIYRPPR